METEKHTLTMLVDNEPGVLSRVVGLFSGRGFNIDSLCVAETMDPGVSRITIVTQANPPLLEQIEKQLRKLINVIKLREMSDDRAVRREMALICVHARPKTGMKFCDWSTCSGPRSSMWHPITTLSKPAAMRTK
jgi:acetolactate synthase I/III small subunit